MRLSVVFELLLVFLFLAFAAARVIDPKDTTKNVAKGKKTATATTTTLRQGPPNRYCACTSRMCNCCRDFSLPVVPIKGPGCASIMYLQKDTMTVTMSFGDRVLSNTTIAGKTPKPICMNLPGGISQFCGRIYGISRKGDQFRACLGLELRALDDIEAALRVSCFKFGPKGVRLESAPPVPADSGGTKDPEDDEDDDYDLDDEDDDLIGFDDDEDASSEDNEVDSDSADYTGFSVLGEDILGTLFSDDSGSSGTKKKKVNKKTAKPQIAIPKTSTTTRRPILPNRRRSTVRPEKVTKRPLIRVTKRPRPSSTKPETVVKPSAPVPSVASPQFEVQSTSITVVPTSVHKNIVTKEPPTTMSLTTMQTVTSGQSQEQEKMPSEEITEATMIHTDSPVTFTIPPLRIETVKNEIKIPQIDLAKVEAVAAIAQQDVTSGVISSSSLTSEETHKPSDKIVTLKIENMTPSELSENTTPYISAMTEKINSVKFVPTTVVTSSPSAEVGSGGMLLDGMVNSEIQENSNYYIIKNKNKITSQIQYTSTESVVQKEKEKEKESEESEENEDESEEEDDDEDDESEEKEQENVATNKVQQNLVSKKNNATISLKKKPSKAESSKPENDEEEQEEEEEEEEEEDDDDILGGVLSDDEDNEEVEEESEESDHKPSQILKPSNKDKVNNDDEENDGNDNEGEILNQTEVNKIKVKPTKVSIKQKPSSNDSENEEEEEEEEEEDDDDILSVLGDDDEEESDDEDDEDINESEGQKKKKKVTSPPPSTTVRVRKPITQVVTQTVTARKPMTTTEKVFTVNEPHTQEVLSGTVTEKVIMYKEPIAKPTENIIIYNEPANKVTEKIFIYKDPENKITQEIPEKVIFYQEPIASATEKLVIYREPEKIITEQPATIVYNKNDNKSSEENKEEESNEEEKDEDSTSEEESDEENDEGQHTLVASIIGKKPGFGNKYGEEHDLPESDGLDIEDAEDEGNDFEEDRKLKQNIKKPNKKIPAPSVSPTVNSNNQKILTLSDLIGQRKKFYETSKNDKPISTSRTHRRMNLDRFLQV